MSSEILTLSPTNRLPLPSAWLTTGGGDAYGVVGKIVRFSEEGNCSLTLI